MTELSNFTQLSTPATEPPSAVRLEKATCRIGKRTVLDQISLSMARGCITGILGPNGSGKTTLLNVISGLRKLSEGTLILFGEPHGQRNPALRQRIGHVFQETALHNELTARENLRFAASLYDIPDPQRRIDEVLDLLGLSLRSQERVGHLSGGLQRRVTIARALLHSPALLLIDEPTLGVDVEARHTIWAHLRLLRSSGTTVVVATNYLDEALALCDTISVLRDGKVLVTAEPSVLVARAGCCLDVECSDEAASILETALTETKREAGGVLRITPTQTGLSVFLPGDVVPEHVIQQVFRAAAHRGLRIQGFRSRGADLAEIFHAWEEASQEEIGQERIPG